MTVSKCNFFLFWTYVTISRSKSYVNIYVFMFFEMRYITAQVGKTSLILSLVSEEFPEEVS